jgi:tetratricopeptide (TPR) repeat protein
MAAYAKAATLEDRIADLHFRMGQCALEAGDARTAATELGKARDLDTLRFRFDSTMHGIVDEIVARGNDPGVRFADAAEAFAAASPDHIPGREFFYEHVHLTWEGNWLLAKTIADQVHELLPDDVKRNADVLPSWPTPEACARRLAWTDYARMLCLREMRRRMDDPPFTNQLDHDTRTEALDDEIRRLGAKAGRAGLGAELSAVASALEAMPDDYLLLTRRSDLLMQAGDPDRAASAARRVTELLPHASTCWSQLGTVLLKANRVEEAIEAFKRGTDLNPDNPGIRHQLAEAYVRDRKYSEAIEAWDHVLRLQPSAAQAHFSLAQVLEVQGETEKADAHYAEALGSAEFQGKDFTAIGRICLEKGLTRGARHSFGKAVEMSPDDAAARFHLASVLLELGLKDEAAREFREVVRLKPADPGIRARLEALGYTADAPTDP